MDLFGTGERRQKIKQIFTYDQLDTEPQHPKDLYLAGTVHRVLASIGGLWRGRPRITPADRNGVFYTGFVGAGLKLVDVNRVDAAAGASHTAAVNLSRYITGRLLSLAAGIIGKLEITNTVTGEVFPTVYFPETIRLWQFAFAIDFEFNQVVIDPAAGTTIYGGIECWNILT